MVSTAAAVTGALISPKRPRIGWPLFVVGGLVSVGTVVYTLVKAPTGFPAPR
jgi:hypothetical protein